MIFKSISVIILNFALLTLEGYTSNDHLKPSSELIDAANNQILGHPRYDIKKDNYYYIVKIPVSKDEEKNKEDMLEKK